MGQEELLEVGMVILSCILTWKVPWTEEPAYAPTVHRFTQGGTRLKQLNISSTLYPSFATLAILVTKT